MSPWRQLIGPLLFGVFAGLLSVLNELHGPLRIVLAIIAGAALMESLSRFAADVRRRP